jgi:hypothetical protein
MLWMTIWIKINSLIDYLLFHGYGLPTLPEHVMLIITLRDYG